MFNDKATQIQLCKFCSFKIPKFFEFSAKRLIFGKFQISFHLNLFEINPMIKYYQCINLYYL